MSTVQTRLRQARAALVAEFAFKQRMERIEWEEDVLKPALKELEQQAGETLSLPEFVILDED